MKENKKQLEALRNIILHACICLRESTKLYLEAKKEQTDVKGFSTNPDFQNDVDELALAAACECIEPNPENWSDDNELPDQFHKLQKKAKKLLEQTIN